MRENPMICAAEALDRLAAETGQTHWLRTIVYIKDAILSMERSGEARFCPAEAQEQIRHNCRAALAELEREDDASHLPVCLRRILFLLAPEPEDSSEAERRQCELLAEFLRRVRGARPLFEAAWAACPEDRGSAERRAFEDQIDTAETTFERMLTIYRNRLVVRQHRAREAALREIERIHAELPSEGALCEFADELNAREAEMEEKWENFSSQTDISKKNAFSIS